MASENILNVMKIPTTNTADRTKLRGTLTARM